MRSVPLRKNRSEYSGIRAKLSPARHRRNAVAKPARLRYDCTSMAHPTIACLDLEGVLVPEIWINVAERPGIAALRRTTRDEPDYDKLMRGRLAILDEHALGLPDIHAVIGGMSPLDG